MMSYEERKPLIDRGDVQSVFTQNKSQNLVQSIILLIGCVGLCIGSFCYYPNNFQLALGGYSFLVGSTALFVTDVYDLWLFDGTPGYFHYYDPKNPKNEHRDTFCGKMHHENANNVLLAVVADI